MNFRKMDKGLFTESFVFLVPDAVLNTNGFRKRAKIKRQMVKPHCGLTLCFSKIWKHKEQEYISLLNKIRNASMLSGYRNYDRECEAIFESLNI